MSKQQITTEELTQFALEITQAQDRAMRIGLPKTRHLLHEAVKGIGWEIAEIINGEHSTTEIKDGNK